MFFTNVSYILLSFGPLESPSTLFIEKKNKPTHLNAKMIAIKEQIWIKMFQARD